MGTPAPPGVPGGTHRLGTPTSPRGTRGYASGPGGTCHLGTPMSPRNTRGYTSGTPPPPRHPQGYPRVSTAWVPRRPQGVPGGTPWVPRRLQGCPGVPLGYPGTLRGTRGYVPLGYGCQHLAHSTLAEFDSARRIHSFSLFEPVGLRIRCFANFEIECWPCTALRAQ